MNHEPMPGRHERDWCSVCDGPSGPDCPTKSRSKRTTRRMGREEINRALAEEAS